VDVLAQNGSTTMEALMTEDQQPDGSAMQAQSEGVLGKANRFLFGNDVFISYARKDATIYSLGLANQLTKRELSCFLDQWGTPAGKELPREVVAALKRSAMMIVLGTEGSGGSKAVAKEIVEFKKTGRTIIPVSFDGSLEKAVWYDELIAGISIAPESEDALKTGTPHENVVSRIVNAENFTRRNKRLRQYFWLTAASVVVMLMVGAIVGWIIVRKANAETRAAQRSAQEAEDKRRGAETEALRLSGVAKDAQQKQQDAEGKASSAAQKEAEATANAVAQQKLAAEQKKVADEQTRRAEEQTKLADIQQKRSQRLTYIGNMQLAQQFLEAGNTKSAQRMLDNFLPASAKDDKNPLDQLRGYEWHYLWRLAHRTTADVPFGNKPATDAKPLRRGQYPRDKPGLANSVAFSPRTKHFVTADEKSLRLWDSTAQPSPALVSKFDGQFRNVNYSRDGSIIAAISESKVCLFKADTLSPLKPISQPDGKKFHAIAFSPTDDSIIATADETGVFFWRIMSNARDRLPTKLPSPGEVKFIVFSRDGGSLGIQTEDQIEVWEIASQKKIISNDPASFYFNGSLWFLPESTRENQSIGIVDGSQLTFAHSKKQPYEFYNLNTGVRFGPNPSARIATAVSPDGRFLAAAAMEPVDYGGGVKIWDIKSRKLLMTFDGVGTGGDVSALAFSPDGQTLAIVDGEGMQLREAVLEPGVSDLQLQFTSEDGVKRTSISPQGNIVATIDGSTLTFWNTSTGKPQRQRVIKGISFIVFSPDGTRYATSTRVGRAWQVELWDAQSDASLGPPLGQVAQPELAFSPDGETLAIGHASRNCYAKCVQFWNTTTKEKRTGVDTARETVIPVMRVKALIFSPNGKLAVFENEMVEGHSIDLIDVETGKTLVNISDMSQSDYMAFAFSPDSKTLAVGSDDSTVVLWNLAPLYERGSAQANEGVQFWEIGYEHFIGLLEGHSQPVRSVAFSPDGKTIASASNDGTVRLWDTTFYQPLVTLRAYEHRVDRVSFAADGRTLITDGDNHHIKLWTTLSDSEVAKQQNPH
jgi:WD40 repeat protein